MHNGLHGGLGGVQLFIGILAALILVAAVWWALRNAGDKSYDRELDEKRRELGVSSDDADSGV